MYQYLPLNYPNVCEYTVHQISGVGTQKTMDFSLMFFFFLGGGVLERCQGISLKKNTGLCLFHTRLVGIFACQFGFVWNPRMFFFTSNDVELVQWKMAKTLKGNYYWILLETHPFLTSMIMGGSVSPSFGRHIHLQNTLHIPGMNN